MQQLVTADDVVVLTLCWGEQVSNATTERSAISALNVWQVQVK